ncbi:hypothetical protein ACFWSF_01485 [Streptomyces sp. NPDC058611]|uniref:hypothetical protein n=1 Tax=unclassified Streptomyces TaxID=2593676 RepID=UPI003657B269
MFRSPASAALRSGSASVGQSIRACFPEKLLREGPQRFLTGAPERGQGTGLGLTIALDQAQVIGARVTLANAEPAGAVATVVLPPGDDPDAGRVAGAGA